MRALRRHVRLVQPNSDMTLIRRPQKKKPPRRRLFNTGRCGVGQGFSHVYSRPTQPLQDSQRDRRNERPRSHHRVRLRRLRRSRARLRSLLRLTGALDVPASSANIRHARAHFARRHLVGSPNAKRPQPTMPSSQRGPTGDDDGRWTTRPDAIAYSRSRSR